MKKILFTILTMLISITAYAVDEHVIYQAWDRGGPEIYYVAAGTETAASYDIGTGSITLHVAGGFNPGDISFNLASAGYNTYTTFASSLTTWWNKGNATDPTINVGMQGKWYFTMPDDVPAGASMTGLATTLNTGCLGVDNKSQILVDTSSTTYYSRYTPAMGNYKRTKIKYIITNYTGSAPQVTIYNSAGTQIHPLVTCVSGSPTYFGGQGDFPTAVSTGNERLEIRVIDSAAITAGYMLIGYMAD